MPPQQQQPAPIPLIGYIRVSMAREEMISPDIQKTTITAWAARTNKQIVGWVIDLDKSGRNLKRKIMIVIGRVEAGEARGVAVMRYDRWGRNTGHSLANISRVEKIGGVVESATEPIDPATAMGRYNRTNALALAEMQSDLIGENWKAARANRQARGLPGSGRARYGYILKGRIRHPSRHDMTLPDPTDPEGERYEPDLDGGTAELLVALYQQYIVGAATWQLTNWMNAIGAYNTAGNPWATNVLLWTLDSGFAAGYLRIHNPECNTCTDQSACRNRIHIPGAQKPLISETTWKAFLARRKQVKDLPPRARKATYALTGLPRCGHCYKAGTHSNDRQLGNGGQIRCSTYSNYGSTICRGFHVRRPIVEDAVRQKVTAWAAILDAHAHEPNQPGLPQARPDTKKLKTELARIDQALTRLVTQRAMDPDMPDQVYETSRAELMKRRKRTEKLITDAETAPRTVHDFAPIVEGLAEEWDILPPAAKRDMLIKLLRHVMIWRSDDGDDERYRIEVTAVWEPCELPCCEKQDSAE